MLLQQLAYEINVKILAASCEKGPDDITRDLHLKSSAKNGGRIRFSFKERFLRFQLIFPDFYHFHHVIWGIKWAKKLKPKNGQNKSSGPLYFIQETKKSASAVAFLQNQL